MMLPFGDKIRELMCLKSTFPVGQPLPIREEI